MVRLWDSRDLRRPLQSNTTHNADVKALAFQPDSDHYLLSGGGTKDQQLCLWNTRTAQPEYTVKTGTQITGLVWHTSDYCVSSHGYSSPGVTLWNINNKSMSKKAEHQIPTKTSHDRALCLAGSKTSPYVATTMSNESLRFFKCDPKTTKSKSTKDNTSMLSTHAMFQSGR